MTEPRKAVLDFVRHERDWIAIHFAAVELAQLGGFSDGWPKLSHDQWRVEIYSAVKDGDLVIDGTRVKFQVKKVEPKMSQGELF
jgi:hypothetical protein